MNNQEDFLKFSGLIHLEGLKDQPFIVGDLFIDKLGRIFSSVLMPPDYLTLKMTPPMNPMVVGVYEAKKEIMFSHVRDWAYQRGLWRLLNLVYVYEICFRHITMKQRLLAENNQENKFFVPTLNNSQTNYHLTVIETEKNKWEVSQSIFYPDQKFERADAGTRFFF